MNQLKKRLIDLAKSENPEIYPCVGKVTLWDCFTREKDRIYLWFNTADNSTHIISKEIQR